MKKTKKTKKTKKKQEDDIIKTAHGDIHEFFQRKPKARCSILETKNQSIINLASIILLGWMIVCILHHYRKFETPFNSRFFWKIVLETPFVSAIHLLLYLYTLICSCLLEYFISRNRNSDVYFFILYTLLQVILFIIPSWMMVMRKGLYPLTRGCGTILICIFSMKMHSYFMSNFYLRKTDHKEYKKRSFWELIKNFGEFLIYPVLVYDLCYPKKKTRSWTYITKNFIQFIAGGVVMYLIVQKSVIPILDEVQNNPLSDFPWAEHGITLAIVTLSLWMIGFYIVFHCILNSYSELIYFADREFYLEWWEATTMSEWWRLWNRPVYKWMRRHIYMETLRIFPQSNRNFAAIGTFIVTAVLHEFVFVVGFSLFTPVFFTLIVAQIPFVFFTQNFKGKNIGNIIIWLAISSGYPVLELSYTYLWVQKFGLE